MTAPHTNGQLSANPGLVLVPEDHGLALVHLDALMKMSSGRHEVVVGLLDGPVARDHPDLATARIRTLGTAHGEHPDGFACAHGTFVAGILAARRGSTAPAICPGCTLLVRPIFNDGPGRVMAPPTATAEGVASALIDCIEAGARVINFSAALTQQPSARGARVLQEAFDHAARRGVIVVAAAGNDRAVGSTIVTKHSWVIPVTACDRRGLPVDSNLGASIGRRGVRAPGHHVTSLAIGGGVTRSGGTSAAAPFVTGALALAWSMCPEASGATVRRAMVESHCPGRPTLVPPLLDASALSRAIQASLAGGE